MNLKLKFTIDKKEWLLAHAIDEKRILISMILVIAMFLVIFIVTKQPLIFIGTALLFAAIIVAAFLAVGRFMLLNDFKRFKFADAEIKWDITDDYIAIDSINDFHSDTEWSKIVSVLENRNGFMFVLAERQFSWLSKAAFKNPADLEKFTELAKEKVKKYKLTVL